MESLTHEHNSFITLTYAEEHIPGNWALSRRELQLFFKRLRKAVYPHKFRYFAVGEYGEKRRRPHYHVSLFGMSERSFVVDKDGEIKPFATNVFNPRTGNIDTVAGLVHDAWAKGRVDVKEFNEATAQYTCGYITKKLRDRKDGLEWNYPEFATMSLNPGIGRPAVEILAKSLLGSAQSWESGDAPRTISVGTRTVGLGRYLLRELREALGFTDQYISEVKNDKGMELSLEVLSMYLSQTGSLTFKEARAKEIAAKLLQIEGRYKIWQSRHPRRRLDDETE